MNTHENIKNNDTFENSLHTARLKQSPNGWIGIRVLRHAMRYPYMFAQPNLGLEMCIAWNPVFGRLCNDIDALLGSDKRGFRWRQLTHDCAAPAWHWRLDPRLDQRLLMTMADGNFNLTVSNPDSDPQNTLRDSISGLVNAAMTRVGSPCAICAQTDEGVLCE